jgi:hypothetical protein
LDRGNIERLTGGEPIKINLADMGGPNITIMMIFGETQKDLFEDIKKTGLLHPAIEFREPISGVKEVIRIKRPAPQNKEPGDTQDISIMDVINNPEWVKRSRVHDWRNHVPFYVQETWHMFTPEQRFFLFRWASDLADQENWDKDG